MKGVPSMIRAAVNFTPDTYGQNSRALGRRVANTAFLRAMVAGRGGEPVVGYGYEAHHGTEFARLVASIDPAASSRWLFTTQVDEFAKLKVIHRLDPSVQAEVAARAWYGLGRYSITAVTHTIFDQFPGLTQFVREPLMPWDALICTSRSVRTAVEAVFDAEISYARWRYGAAAAPQLPELPVIPLGVHVEDFARFPARRAEARHELGLAENEVVALYVGRLSLMSKAHPGQMYQGLEATTRNTGQKITLIECGWPKTDNDAAAFPAGAQILAPSVRRLQLDGNDAVARSRAWSAADIFISLSDNIQETFGLTPLEAMAAGLPVVASDWDGYRDTVRHGVDGFLVPTWSPAVGLGNHLAFAHQGRTITSDTLSWGAAVATSVELDRLVEALTALVSNPDLRRSMGSAGQAHARQTFDWAEVYRSYQALWAELDARRLRDGQEVAAPRPGGQLEPFSAFAAYPSSAISGQTVAALRSGASLQAFAQLAGHPLFPSGAAAPEVAVPLWRSLEAAPRAIEDAAQATGLPLRACVVAAGVLAKMGFVDLRNG